MNEGTCCVVEPHHRDFMWINYVGEAPQKVWLKSWEQCMAPVEHVYTEPVVVKLPQGLVTCELVLKVCAKHMPKVRAD